MITSEFTGIFRSVKSIRELLKTASSVLENVGIPDARREACGLLEAASGLTRTGVISNPERLIESEVEKLFSSYVERRARREPFHYIIGKKDFFGLEFEVDARVLIPRPETEFLVECALEGFRNIEHPFFCEVGVGSGCISVSILKTLANAKAVGFDISKDAIDVAAFNAIAHGVENRIEFVESDIFTNSPSSYVFDAILSNPPYIAVGDLNGLESEVKDYEPRLALTDGESGLSLIKRIIEDGFDLLRESGFMAIEIGFDQAGAVESMFSEEKWMNLHFIKDLQGHERIAVATRRPSPASK